MYVTHDHRNAEEGSAHSVISFGVHNYLLGVAIVYVFKCLQLFLAVVMKQDLIM